MKKLILVITFLLISSTADAFTLQPWTTTETSLFTNTSVLAGSGWSGNDLTLIYDATTASSSTSVIPNFIPAGVTGLSLGIERTTGRGRTRVVVQGRQNGILLGQNQLIDLQSDMDFSLVTVGSNIFNETTTDIPETIVNGITNVNFFFSSPIINAPNSLIAFNTHSLSPDGGTVIGGTTIYHNVSWILGDPPTSDPIPEPATIALLGIGLAGLAGGAVRRRRKKTKQ